jgi:hypothetical protein
MWEAESERTKLDCLSDKSKRKNKNEIEIRVKARI